MNRALVLSGGSIKGAFQAGAIAEILRAGFVPDAIYGTSVGSLNGAFLAERAGRAKRKEEALDWPGIGAALESLWLEELKSPAQVARKRGALALVAALVRSKFDGLIDTRPLRQMVQQQMEPDNLRASPVKFSACSVNLATGEPIYATPDYSGILDYIIASTAIPIEMPVSMIGKAPYVDGGIREVAPLKRAIDDGAEEIVCVVCQPQSLQGVAFRPGNLPEFAFRLMDVVINELVNNDLERFNEVNSWVEAFQEVQTEVDALLAQTALGQDARTRIDELMSKLPFNTWRQIPITVIRPQNEIVLDLLGFTRKEIEEVIKQGRNAARAVIGSGAWCSGETGAEEAPSTFEGEGTDISS